MRWSVAMLLCAGGCSTFLGGDNQPPPAEDGGTDENPDADIGCISMRVVSLVVVSDTELSEENSGQNHGSDKGAALHGSNNGMPNTRGIDVVRFSGANAIDVDKLLSMELRWEEMVSSSSACGGGGSCVSCTDNFVPGDADVRFLTNDWIENEATWDNATDADTWDMDNFSGGEASPIIGSTQYQPGNALLFPINAPDLASQFEAFRDQTANQLSVMLAPAAGDLDLRVLNAMKENNEQCDLNSTSFPPAQLNVTVCND